MADKKIKLVFGTSADPIHQGHVELLINATKALIARGFQVTEIVLLPVYRHHSVQDSVKRSLPLSYEFRFDLCQLAANEIEKALKGSVDKVSVSDLEKELVWQSSRPNFTTETMQAMREKTEEETELAFLVGADSFSGEHPGFSQWYRWQELIKSVMLVLSPREGYPPNRNFVQSLSEHGGKIVYLDDIKVPEISSAQIRKRLESGEETQNLVEEGIISREVADYIEKHNLPALWKQSDDKQPVESIREKILETDSIEIKIGKHLFEQKLSLSLAESSTGGLIGHLITNVPGSSDYFIGSIVSYAYEVKVNLLGVKWETLQKFGAVSSETVIEMAQGAREVFKTDLALSVCCIAGPGGATTDKPLGTSWIGLSSPDGDWSWHFQLEGNREEIKHEVTQKALEQLLNYLETR